jgi:ribosome-binding factor A
MVKRAEQASGPSQRQLRVGEAVRHALAAALTRGIVSDPVLDGRIVTVPEVRMSPDLKIATCYVVPLGGTGGAQVVKALARHVKPLKAEVSRQMRDMKYMPDLRFRLDETFDAAGAVDRLLARPEVRRDLSDDGETGGGA